MSEYKISERAYAKMIFHAAKYPHLAVNGILLAEKKSPVNIVDAIPLFHQCLYVTPMAEIALMQIDAYAERNNYVIAGYYAAAEHFNDNTIEKAPAPRIADKIYENNKQACFVVIDNTRMSIYQPEPAIIVYAHSNSNSGSSSSNLGQSNDSAGSSSSSLALNAGRWSKANFNLIQSQTTLKSVSALLERGAMKDIIDFDNHLDNPENDWTNEFLNRDLKQIMAMY